MNALSQQQCELLDLGYNITLWNRGEALGLNDVFEHDSERLIVVGHGLPMIDGKPVQRLTVRRAPFVSKQSNGGSL